MILLFILGGGAVSSLIFPRPAIDNNINSQDIVLEDVQNIEDSAALVFYTNSCPFCENLLKYVNENESNIDLEIKSLKIDNPTTDKANLELVLSKLKECNITEGWGVPLLYHEGKCIMGDKPAMDYFEQYLK